MCRPHDADGPEKLERSFDGALRSVQVRVQVRSEASDGSRVDEVLRGCREQGESFLREGVATCEDLALRKLKLELESQAVARPIIIMIE
jgi:hypothetical protein